MCVCVREQCVYIPRGFTTSHWVASLGGQWEGSVVVVVVEVGTQVTTASDLGRLP